MRKIVFLAIVVLLVVSGLAFWMLNGSSFEYTGDGEVCYLCLKGDCGAFFDAQGKQMSDFSYEATGYIWEGAKYISVLSVDKKWGLVDLKAREVIKPKYSRIELLAETIIGSNNHGSENMEQFVLSPDGKRLSAKEYFSLYPLGSHEPDYLFYDKRNSRVGVMNSSFEEEFSIPASKSIGKGWNRHYLVKDDAGQYLINPQGERISSTYSHIASIAPVDPKEEITSINAPRPQSYYLQDGFYSFINDHCEGLLDMHGKEIVRAKEVQYLHEGLFELTNEKDGTRALYSFRDGVMKESIDFKIDKFFEGMAVFEVEGKSQNSKEGRRYGYVNASGEVVIPAIYEVASNFIDGSAKVCRENVWFLVNKQGERISEEYPWDRVIKASRKRQVYTDESVYVFEKGAEIGLIDHSGKVLWSSGSEESVKVRITQFNSFGAIVKKGSDWFFLVYSEGLIPLPEAESADILDKNHVRFESNGKTGIWKKGEGIIIPAQYSWASLLFHVRN